MAIDTLLTNTETPINEKHMSLLNRTIFEEIKCTCPKILIVDDEPFNIIAVQGQLEMFGIFSTDKAFNGKEALDKVIANHNNQECLAGSQHKQYTAIFLDLNMPIMNGAETAIKIREMQSSGQIF